MPIDWTCITHAHEFSFHSFAYIYRWQRTATTVLFSIVLFFKNVLWAVNRFTVVEVAYISGQQKFLQVYFRLCLVRKACKGSEIWQYNAPSSPMDFANDIIERKCRHSEECLHLLKNKFSNQYVMFRWSHFLTWSELKSTFCCLASDQIIAGVIIWPFL